MTCKNSVVMAVLLLAGTSLSHRPVDAQRGENRCEFSADITAELAATSEELIRVEAGSGSLTVEGRAGLSTVRVTGLACASDEWMLEELRVSLERRGSVVELETFHPRASRGRNSYARIDLEVEVPLGMDAEIDDGSGWASLRVQILRDRIDELFFHSLVSNLDVVTPIRLSVPSVRWYCARSNRSPRPPRTSRSSR